MIPFVDVALTALEALVQIKNAKDRSDITKIWEPMYASIAQTDKEGEAKSDAVSVRIMIENDSKQMKTLRNSGAAAVGKAIIRGVHAGVSDRIDTALNGPSKESSEAFNKSADELYNHFDLESKKNEGKTIAKKQKEDKKDKGENFNVNLAQFQDMHSEFVLRKSLQNKPTKPTKIQEIKMDQIRNDIAGKYKASDHQIRNIFQTALNGYVNTKDVEVEPTQFRLGDKIVYGVSDEQKLRCRQLVELRLQASTATKAVNQLQGIDPAGKRSGPDKYLKDEGESLAAINAGFKEIEEFKKKTPQTEFTRTFSGKYTEYDAILVMAAIAIRHYKNIGKEDELEGMSLTRLASLVRQYDLDKYQLTESDLKSYQKLLGEDAVKRLQDIRRDGGIELRPAMLEFNDEKTTDMLIKCEKYATQDEYTQDLSVTYGALEDYFKANEIYLLRLLKAAVDSVHDIKDNSQRQKVQERIGQLCGEIMANRSYRYGLHGVKTIQELMVDHGLLSISSDMSEMDAFEVKIKNIDMTLRVPLEKHTMFDNLKGKLSGSGRRASESSHSDEQHAPPPTTSDELKAAIIELQKPRKDSTGAETTLAQNVASLRKSRSLGALMGNVYDRFTEKLKEYESVPEYGKLNAESGSSSSSSVSLTGAGKFVAGAIKKGARAVGSSMGIGPANKSELTKLQVIYLLLSSVDKIHKLIVTSQSIADIPNLLDDNEAKINAEKSKIDAWKIEIQGLGDQIKECERDIEKAGKSFDEAVKGLNAEMGLMREKASGIKSTKTPDKSKGITQAMIDFETARLQDEFRQKNAEQYSNQLSDIVKNRDAKIDAAKSREAGLAEKVTACEKQIQSSEETIKTLEAEQAEIRNPQTKKEVYIMHLHSLLVMHDTVAGQDKHKYTASQAGSPQSKLDLALLGEGLPTVGDAVQRYEDYNKKYRTSSRISQKK